MGDLRVCRFEHNDEAGPVITQVCGLAVRAYGTRTDHTAVLARFVCQAALRSSFGGFPLRSSSIHSILPRNGWRSVMPIFPPEPPRGKLTAIIRPLTMFPFPKFR